MKEFKDLIKMCEEINKYGRDVTVEQVKSLYRITGLTRCKAISGNYKQICDLLFRELRDEEAKAQQEQQDFEHEKAMEAEEIQADYEREMQHYENYWDDSDVHQEPDHE